MTLPADVSVIPEGRGEYRRVVLSIEGTTFELHPDDARLIGAALLDVAVEAEAEPPQALKDVSQQGLGFSKAEPPAGPPEIAAAKPNEAA